MKQESRLKKLLRDFGRIYTHNALFAIGFTICLLWVLVAIFAPLIAPYDPIAQDFTQRFAKPSAAHLFGTDNFGRDIFSRVVMGSRTSILAGFTTVILASIFGTIYGGIAGYAGGVVDDVLMRIAEMVSAFPALILAMVITSALGSSLFNTLFALVIVSWPNYARVVRSMVLTIKENDYVAAAKALGTRRSRILLREIIPNTIGQVMIMATLELGNAILNFAGLSFLGLGAPPPAPEWGAMVSDGIDYFFNWWIPTFPGLAILTMSVGANLMGDSIRDLMDPKLRKNF